MNTVPAGDQNITQASIEMYPALDTMHALLHTHVESQ